MFRDPAYFRAVARARRAAAADLPVAEDLGRGLQHRRRGLLARDPAARGRPARAHADLRDRHQPARAAEGRGRRLRRRPHRRLHREPPQVGRAIVAVGLLHRGLRPRGVRQVAQAAASCSPITAWPPTACSPRCSSSPAATCSSTSTASCRTARSGCSATRCAAGVPRARREGDRCGSRRTPTPSPSSCASDRIYQKRDAA